MCSADGEITAKQVSPTFPRQQGLKHQLSPLSLGGTCRVSPTFPRQQGLKSHEQNKEASVFEGLTKISTTTRIETQLACSEARR